jgi:hypothetical protein
MQVRRATNDDTETAHHPLQPGRVPGVGKPSRSLLEMVRDATDFFTEDVPRALIARALSTEPVTDIWMPEWELPLGAYKRQGGPV